MSEWKRTLAVVMAAFLAAGCVFRDPPADQGVSDRIANHIRHTPGTVLDFATLAPFSWARLFIFQPYTSEEAAERALGFKWKYAWGAIETWDDRALLVFVDSGRVISAFEHTLDRGNFTSAARPEGFSHDSARFDFVRQGMLTGGAPNNVAVWRP